MKKITKNEYKQAGIDANKIKAVMPSLADIADKTIGADSGTVTAFCNLLQVALDKNQKIIINGQRQYDSRDDKFIARLLNLSMAIPEQLDSLDRSLRSKIECRSAKIDELTKQGFSLIEIDKISPPVTDQELEAYGQQKACLMADAEAINAFVNDSPEFRLSLLPDHLAELA